MLALCDAGCGKTFDAPKVLLDELDDGIEKSYIRCSHCLREYVMFYTDEFIRELQSHIKKKQMKLSKAKKDSDRMRIGRGIEGAQLDIKKKMDALKGKINAESYK